MPRSSVRRPIVLAAVALGLSCAAPALTPEPPPVASAAPPASISAEPVASIAPPLASASASASASPPAPDHCPAGMIYVDGTYCPRVERHCLRTEENKPNHLTLCHKFAHETRCLDNEEPRKFCIDEYEYPDEKGAHPPWMVSWYDAQATCESKGKRLCYESEWVTACEGPEHLPFPYGWDRDQTACNIDNAWIDPKKNRETKAMAMYSKNQSVADAELARLDQSVASGAMDRCVSGYGVHDMTGNFDEWVTRDSASGAKDKSEWAGLKGGAWGHVRNACRPMTTSHPPDFTYYFVSFRCCADAEGEAPYVPTKGEKAPNVKPADKAPIPHPINPVGPSARKVQPEN